MFKKMLLIITALGISTSALASRSVPGMAMQIGVSVGSYKFATDTKFRCDTVNGTEEWTIYVDLEKEIAGFFDNDSTVVVPLKREPIEGVYVFEGENTSAAGKLQIYFNKTKMIGNITTDVGTKASDTMWAQDGCVADPKVEIDYDDDYES